MMKTLCIVPAMLTYRNFMVQPVDTTYEFLLEALRAHETDDMQKKVQAWEDIRAYVQVLKDCDCWDEENGLPLQAVIGGIPE